MTTGPIKLHCYIHRTPHRITLTAIDKTQVAWVHARLGQLAAANEITGYSCRVLEREFTIEIPFQSSLNVRDFVAEKVTSHARAAGIEIAATFDEFNPVSL